MFSSMIDVATGSTKVKFVSYPFSFGKIMSKKAQTISTSQPYIKHLLYYSSSVLCAQDTVIDRSDSPDGLEKKIKGLSLRLR